MNKILGGLTRLQRASSLSDLALRPLEKIEMAGSSKGLEESVYRSRLGGTKSSSAKSLTEDDKG
jgi:hypothetical protein